MILRAVLACGLAWGTAALAETCPRVPVSSLHGLTATRAAVAAGKPVTIVTLGSSSTEGSGASAPDRTYPARLAAALTTALPRRQVQVINAGKGGQEADQMAARLEADVLAHAPTLVIWQAGANGALRGHDVAAFRAVMEAGVARLRAAGVDVVLMDNQRAPRVDAAPGHDAFDTALAEIARSGQAALFSRGRLMDRWIHAGRPLAEFVGGDGLHHTDLGYACLGAALADALVPTLTPPVQMAVRPR